MWGSKIFSLNDSQVSVIEVALSVPLYQYLERKCFRFVCWQYIICLYFYFINLFYFSKAYQIACLNVTDSDWKILAQEALENFNFLIAKKAFARIKELKYIELITEYEVNINLFLNNTYPLLLI